MSFVQPLEILVILGIFASIILFVILAVFLSIIALFEEVVLRRKKNSSLRRPQEEN